MGQTLTNGIYLPNEGERNCYSGLAANWNAVDTLKGNYSLHAINVDIHVTAAEKETWNGKADASALTAHTGDTTIHVTSADKQAWNGKADASALTAHTGDTTIHVTSADKQAWNGKADASALTAHTGDTTIHVTAEDKEAWNGKADASALTAHTGDTTIHVTAEDKQAWDGHVSDSVKHVTAEDKAKWDAVTSKANDSDVVHKSGDETISGNKTFSSNVNIYNSDSSTDTANIVLKNSKAEVGTEFAEQSINFVDKNNSPLAKISCYGSSGSYTRLYITASDSNNNSGGIFLRKSSAGTMILPTAAGAVALGNSSAYFYNVQTSRVNGLTPSSLSLPSDRSARIDISSYFTNTGTSQSNSYTVPANGYIYLTLSELTSVHCFSRTSGNVTNYAQTFTKLSSTGALYVLFPVRKNDVFVATWYTTTTVSVDGAFFIPCQGNI